MRKKNWNCAASPKGQTKGKDFGLRRGFLTAVLLCGLLALSACGKKPLPEDTAVAGKTEDFSTDDLSANSVTADLSDFSSTIDQAASQDTSAGAKKEEEPFSAVGKDLTIALDPGHSSQVAEGTEPLGPGASETKVKDTIGLVGKSSSTYEYDLTMNVSKKLRAELEKRGYKVVLTHADTILPISGSERAAAANESKADAFVRIYANSSEDTSVHGAEAVCITEKNPYHPDLFPSSFRLAEVLLNTYCEKTGASLQRIWMTDSMTGNNWSEVPTALIRLGYMTNPDEDLMMNQDSYRLEMAAAIADGIDLWFAQMPESEKSMHPSLRTGAAGNEAAALSSTSDGTAASGRQADYTAPSGKTPASTTPGNDPEAPSDTVPAGTAAGRTDQTLAPQDPGSAVDPGTPAGTAPLVTEPSTVTTTTDINKAAELGTPAGTAAPTSPAGNTTNTTNGQNNTPGIPPLSPTPGSDGSLEDSEYLYFSNDDGQAINWDSADGDDAVDFQEGDDDTTYPGGELSE